MGGVELNYHSSYKYFNILDPRFEVCLLLSLLDRKIKKEVQTEEEKEKTNLN